MFNVTQDINSTLDLFTIVNTDFMNGLFGILIMMVIMTISFISMHTSTNSIKNAWLGSAFITFILAIPLQIIGLISNAWLGWMLVNLVLAVGFSFKNNL